MLFLHWVVSLRLAKTSFPVVSFFSYLQYSSSRVLCSGIKQILVKARDWTRFVKAPRPICIIIQLFELIVILDGVYKQFSVIDDGNVLNIDEVKSIIHLICTT